MRVITGRKLMSQMVVMCKKCLATLEINEYDVTCIWSNVWKIHVYHGELTAFVRCPECQCQISLDIPWERMAWKKPDPPTVKAPTTSRTASRRCLAEHRDDRCLLEYKHCGDGHTGSEHQWRDGYGIGPWKNGDGRPISIDGWVRGDPVCVR